jgi:hypothetical protein
MHCICLLCKRLAQVLFLLQHQRRQATDQLKTADYGHCASLLLLLQRHTMMLPQLTRCLLLQQLRAVTDVAFTATASGAAAFAVAAGCTVPVLLLLAALSQCCTSASASASCPTTSKSSSCCTS